MLELVMVIVVLGILAALAIPRIERDLRQEAADNILSAIRYTQHLALTDDKHEFDNAQWQRKFWAIHFTSSTADTYGNFYEVCSDNDKTGTITKTECATDPANGKYMYNTTGVTSGIDPDESPNIFIGKKYGVDTIALEGGCANNNGANYIGFDHLGRPHVSFLGSTKPDYASYMGSDCKITFSSSNNAFSSFKIIIEKETGYAYIDEQSGS